MTGNVAMRHSRYDLQPQSSNLRFIMQTDKPSDEKGDDHSSHLQNEDHVLRFQRHYFGHHTFFKKRLANDLIVCGRSLNLEELSAPRPASFGKLVRAKKTCTTATLQYTQNDITFPFACLKEDKYGELVSWAVGMRWDPQRL
jgi:hypothetical protein